MTKDSLYVQFCNCIKRLTQVDFFNSNRYTGDEEKPVTAARKFIQAEGILPPALLLVKRNEHTTDRYFWAEKGLFGAQYVEENHFLFPSLRVLESPQEKELVAAH